MLERTGNNIPEANASRRADDYDVDQPTCEKVDEASILPGGANVGPH